MSPFVSIITPSYNQGQYIRETIESVLSQDYSNVEHIVIDGSSTDETVAILKEYGQRYPDRFRWVSEPDNGQSDAFNKGLGMARGELVGWQNSDDYYLPGAISALVEAWSDPTAVVYGGCALIDDNGKRLDKSRHPKTAAIPFDAEQFLIKGAFVLNQSALIPRAALVAVGGLDVTLHYCMDYDLWLRLLPVTPFLQVNHDVGVFRLIEGTKTVSGRAIAAQEHLGPLNRFFARADIPLRLRRYRDEVVARRHLDVAFKYFGALRADEGLYHWHEARKHIPIRVLTQDVSRLSQFILDSVPPVLAGRTEAMIAIGVAVRAISSVQPDIAISLRRATTGTWYAREAVRAAARGKQPRHVLAYATNALARDRRWIWRRVARKLQPYLIPQSIAFKRSSV